MKIELIERNYDIGNRLGDLIEKKVSKLDRYFNDDVTCRIVCSLQNKIYKMEVTMLNKGSIFRAEVVGENMYENIDKALPKIERQIIKQSGKRKDYFKKAAFDIPTYEFLDEKPEEDDKTIYKKKAFDLNPMMLEDAEMELDNLDHDFYVFLNAETGKVNVLYRRKDKKLGLIECNY